MSEKTLPYDSAAVLDTPQAIGEYLTVAFETSDSALIAHALGVVAKARGMSELARETGLSRQSLYRALSADGRPELPTLVKVMKAFGVRLAAVEASR
ncbi:MAG TPA: addiction module antidote protein [Caulobacteraceae bacterium]|jgi:probable addiction module antidote protein